MTILIIFIVIIAIIVFATNSKNKNSPEDIYSKTNEDLFKKTKIALEENKKILDEIQKENEQRGQSIPEKKEIKQKSISLKKWAEENQQEEGVELTGEDFFRFKTNKVESQYLKPQIDLEDKSHEFYGKKVVITGSFNDFPFRNELAHLLWSVGADIDTSITKNVDIVIMGDEPGWKKLELIEQFQPQVIDQHILLELFPNYKPKF